MLSNFDGENEGEMVFCVETGVWIWGEKNCQAGQNEVYIGNPY